MASPSHERTLTLLFAHGGGLCKEAWEPIMRRVRASPLLQRTPTELRSLDFPYHGSKRDNSVAPRVFAIGPRAQRVSHPASAWVSIATQEIVDYVREFKTQHPTKPLIGVGHSMGAVALWLAEIRHPGSFDGLILFEPMYGLPKPETAYLQDMLVGATLRREGQWPSREAALSHLYGFKNFKTWDREALDAYLKGALVEEADGTIALACHPHIEAATYCGFPGWVSADESTRPQCRVSFQGGERSPFFAVDHFEVMRAQSPHIYKVGSAMPQCSHAMVMENPALATQKILEDLAEMPVFAVNQPAASSSRL
ncbi:Ppr repeat protein [Globisporangium polare]